MGGWIYLVFFLTFRIVPVGYSASIRVNPDFTKRRMY